MSPWLWLVKWLLALPHMIVLVFLWIAFAVLSVVALVAIVVTGRYPEFDLAAEASKLVGQDGLVSVGTPAEILRRELVRALPALRSLPEHAETLGDQLRSGRLVLRSERYAGGDRRIVEAWIDRVLVAVASGISALTSGTVLVAAAMMEDSDIRDTLWVLGFSGLTAATVLLLRTVAQGLHGQSVRGK